MPRDVYPVRPADGQAVIALPEHVDLSNAARIGEELLSAINHGATTLIADMTATISCDHAGADVMARAHRRAVASGTQLRLVVTAPVVRRLLGFTGLDRLVPIYPSLEAAVAAWRPAPAAAGLPDGDAAAVTPAVVRKLVDALEDGVALAADDGMMALASSRLEEMFGYQHAELTGQPVDSLFLDGPPEPGARPAVAGARLAGVRLAGVRLAGVRLAGVRKDGSTFPVRVRRTPVLAAAGPFTLTIVRDITGAAPPRGSRDAGAPSADVLDSVINGLLRAGLSLQAALGLPGDEAALRIGEAIGCLDDAIRGIRGTAFTALGRPEQPWHAQPDDARPASGGRRLRRSASVTGGPGQSGAPAGRAS